MSIASQYYEKYPLLVTANGNDSLNGLKSHNDKIQLTDSFGRYLYSKVVAEDLKKIRNLVIIMGMVLICMRYYQSMVSL